MTKGLSKGFKSFRKFSLGQQAQRALIGDKNYDKLHFISTGTIKNAGLIRQAEKDKETAEELAAEQRAQQKTALAELDDEENRRIKKLITGSRGTRNYRGGPMFRARASDTAGRSAPRTAAGGSSSAASAPALRSGGARGGLARTGYRALLP
ncbi:MAG: hypothetical protein LLG14_27590 [Nocardiaceae bacterium]|nr:hypothetical protein [Nocardiaceae bacterium]